MPPKQSKPAVNEKPGQSTNANAPVTNDNSNKAR